MPKKNKKHANRKKREEDKPEDDAEQEQQHVQTHHDQQESRQQLAPPQHGSEHKDLNDQEETQTEQDRPDEQKAPDLSDGVSSSENSKNKSDDPTDTHVEPTNGSKPQGDTDQVRDNADSHSDLGGSVPVVAEHATDEGEERQHDAEEVKMAPHDHNQVEEHDAYDDDAERKKEVGDDEGGQVHVDAWAGSDSTQTAQSNSQPDMTDHTDAGQPHDDKTQIFVPVENNEFHTDSEGGDGEEEEEEEEEETVVAVDEKVALYAQGEDETREEELEGRQNGGQTSAHRSIEEQGGLEATGEDEDEDSNGDVWGGDVTWGEDGGDVNEDEDGGDVNEDEDGEDAMSCSNRLGSDRLLEILGEIPPDFAAPKGDVEGDVVDSDVEEADADPGLVVRAEEDAAREGRAGDEDEGEGAKLSNGHEKHDDDNEEEEEEEEDDDDMGTERKGEKKSGQETKEDGREVPGASRKADKQEAVAALAPSQRATVRDLFLKKVPERVADGSRKLALAFLILEGQDFPSYEPYEELSWWPHRLRLQVEDKRPGIRAAIVRTETRGPKSAMYTTYVIHVKTAFHVRGVARRFSDFKLLDRKLRARFPFAPPLAMSSRILGTLSPGFVQERRQQLQEYLDKILADHQLAHSDILKTFMALNGCSEIGEEEAAREEEGRAKGGRTLASKRWEVNEHPIARLLEELGKCRSAKEAPRETKLLNKIGLIMCDLGNKAEGLVYLQKAVASARLSSDRHALLTCLSNLACAHLKFGGEGTSIDLLEEAVEIAQRLGDMAEEANILRKIALAHASDGETAAALRFLGEAKDLFHEEEHVEGEAMCLLSLGILRYESGEHAGGIDALEESLQLRRTLKDKLGIAEVLNRIGLSLVDIGYPLQALDYFERALALAQEVGDAQGEAQTLRMLAYVHLAQVDGDRKLSLELFRKSLSYSKRNGDVGGQAACYEGMGDVLMDMDDAKTAATHYTQALSMREGWGLGKMDPQGHMRHVQLIRSKIARAKAQILESSGNGDESSDGEGDFLWRSNNGVNTDNELDPIAEDREVSKQQESSNGNLTYLKELASSTITSALTRIWS